MIDRQRLISAARRLLASRADAEDAVQDTYVRALATFPNRLEYDAPWLHIVLRNIAIDRLRRKRVDAEQVNAGSPVEESLEPPMDLRFECEAALRHLLSRASLAEAAAILLRDVFEFDYDEIGRAVGKSNTACRQFLHRARTRARRSDQPSDVDDLHVGLLWRSIEARDPALLMHLLQLTTAFAHPAGTAAEPLRGGERSSSVLVQVNGRYAMALVLDGVVLCIVPVGVQTTSAAELA